jgi:hypothetical protein
MKFLSGRGGAERFRTGRCDNATASKEDPLARRNPTEIRQSFAA